MPAFIDPDATAVYTVREHVAVCKKDGDCECPPVCICPNTPHPFDTVTARTRIGMGDMAKISRAVWAVDQQIVLLSVAIKDWTFTNPKGEKVDIGMATINLLDPDLGSDLAAWIDNEITKAKLPNGSGVRSQPESPASSDAPPTSPTA